MDFELVCYKKNLSKLAIPEYVHCRLLSSFLPLKYIYIFFLTKREEFRK